MAIGWTKGYYFCIKREEESSGMLEKLYNSGLHIVISEKAEMT
jgi:hypothetical protein